MRTTDRYLHLLAAVVLAAVTVFGIVRLLAGFPSCGVAGVVAAGPDKVNAGSLMPRITIIAGEPLLESATGIAVDEAGSQLYVTGEVPITGQLLRIDTGSGVVTTITSTLNQPGHLVVSNTWAYVAGNLGQPITLMRVDLTDGSLMPVSNDLGGGLSGVAVNRALTQAYVVNFGSGVLSRVTIDPAATDFKQVTQIAGGLNHPRDVVLDGPETTVYVTEQDGGQLVKVNVDPTSPGYSDVTSVATGLGGPRGLTLSRDGSKVFLAEEWDRELSVVVVDPISGSYGSVTVILDEQALRDVALSANELQAFVTDVDDGVLGVDVDPTSPDYGTVIRNYTPPPLNGARGLWINESNTRAYVACEFSGYLNRVNIDQSSPGYGQVEALATGLPVPVDVVVDKDEAYAYLAREQGPNSGNNVVNQIDIATGQVATVTDQVGQPVDLHWTANSDGLYVTDLMNGQIHQVSLPTGTVSTLLTGLTKPFGMALAQDGKTAYLVTEPASPSFPPGDLIGADLSTGNWSILAEDVISGATSIQLNQAEDRVYVTHFGLETACTGRLSWFDIDPASPTYLQQTDILTGLCGAHDLQVAADERRFYVVLVGARQLIRIDMVEPTIAYLPVVVKD